MQALGNDFIVLNCLQEPFSLSAQQLQFLANRKLGVGFDQCLVLEKSTESSCDFNYRIFNADGSEAEQCGNGARAIALYIHLNNLAPGNQWRLKTLNNIIELQFADQDHIAVNMGQPEILPQSMPQQVYVSMGNPHTACLIDDLIGADVATFARMLDVSAIFPNGTNVEFVAIENEKLISLRTVERGVGETLACGSGACAAMAALRSFDMLADEVVVRQAGGDLTIRWQGIGSDLWMVGPARMVFEGSLSSEF